METRYHAFLDESGQRRYAHGTDRYFVVAGAISRVETVGSYADEFRGLKRAFFGSPDVEVKSHWLRQPDQRRRHYLDAYGISERRLHDFTEAFYGWVLATDVVLIAGVIDKEQMCEQYKDPHHPSAVAYQVFLQRYQKFLAQRHSKGAVTFDIVSGASPAGRAWQELLTKHHRKLKKWGCNYTRLRFTNVERELAFANSATVDLIQVADICAYNTFRQFKDHGNIWDDPSSRELPTYEYFDRLLPRFHQGPHGVFAGFGVAKMPKIADNRWRA